MDVLAPLLPDVYAPLQRNGYGLQGVYLTRLSDSLAGALADLLGAEARDLIRGTRLTPNADHLFDRGFIGFEDNGEVLISPVAHKDSLARLGLNPNRPMNVGQFSEGQRRYLEFHRDSVLLRSRFLEE